MSKSRKQILSISAMKGEHVIHYIDEELSKVGVKRKEFTGVNENHIEGRVFGWIKTILEISVEEMLTHDHSYIRRICLEHMNDHLAY